MIAMKLETPDKIRKLQRALYTSAKREPEFRFYALYDKTYRKDILAHAYAQCRANRGAAGPDGQSFEDIERSGVEALLTQLAVQLKDKTYRPGPVRRVYIPKSDGGERPLGIPNIADRVVQMAVKLVLEPIYEADFDPSSYGFRPERGAHQALVETRACMQEGIVWVIDADVSKYFDTIPHDRLMKVVATRIVDSSMLALVKLFHTAPVIDEGAGGGPRRPKAGVPQGGVSSPLLANIYLHLLDRSFRKRVERGDWKGRLIRYADDFVILSYQEPGCQLSWLRVFMTRLGLELHPTKTKVVDTREEGFDFLGYHVSRYEGEVQLDISRRSRRNIHMRLRGFTRLSFLAIDEVVDRLNRYIRGARGYYYLAPWWSLRRMDSMTAMRMARWWSKKHSLKQPAWSLVSGSNLQKRHGLVTWAGRPPWDRQLAWAHE